MFKKIQLSVIFTLLFSLFSFMQFSGCGDDTVVPPIDDTDQNVVYYNNLSMYYSRDTVNTDAHHTVNLYDGIVRRGISSDKDMELIDLSSNFTNFYFRTGSSTLDIGYDTWFGKVSIDASQTEWDTISYIPVTTLDSLFFDKDNTRSFGFLEPGTIAPMHPIYGFYLKGKFAAGLTNNKRVYGLIYVKDFMFIDGDHVKVTIDIKLNKAGENKFKK